MTLERTTCGLCGSNRPRGTCHIIVLTDAEKQQLVASNQTPKKEYVYCKPCWRTLSNPATAPSVIKGLVVAHLRRLGVPDAEKIAQKFYLRLIERVKSPPS